MLLSCQLHAPVTFYPAHTEQETRWVPKPVWMVWRRGKSVASARNPTTFPCYPTCTLIMIQITLVYETKSKSGTCSHQKDTHMYQTYVSYYCNQRPCSSSSVMIIWIKSTSTMCANHLTSTMVKPQTQRQELRKPKYHIPSRTYPKTNFS